MLLSPLPLSSVHLFIFADLWWINFGVLLIDCAVVGIYVLPVLLTDGS